MKYLLLGHFLAFLSVFLWSALYVSVKILLESFGALELLFLQFIVGYIFLILLKPKFLKTTLKQELSLALAGLCGISIYNLFLNLAMLHSSAFNVSVIIALTPLFVALLTNLLKIEKTPKYFLLGFLLSLCGIMLLNLKDFKLNFGIGDIFALLSTLGWACYCIIITNIFKPQQESLILTRKMVFYGIIFITPTLFFENISFNLAPLLESKIFLNLLFVAFFASAFCFILWNKAIILIGSIRTNIYVYLTPVITLFASAIFLDESIQSLAIAGMILVLSGVFVATRR